MSDTAREITYGSVAGMCGKLVEYPFDTIKVRLQSSAHFRSSSTIQAIKETYTQEGIVNGFYKGLKAPLVGACLETAVLFSSYQWALAKFKENKKCDEVSLAVKSGCGGFSGFMAAFVLTPVELVKCRLQVENVMGGHSVATQYGKVIRTIIRSDGVLGLWSGLLSTMIREIGGTAIWFTTYEYCLQKFGENSPLTTKHYLFSGALAGITFNLSMFPVDTIKSNIQVSHGSIVNTAARLLAAPGGIRNLYHGLGITLIRAAPANALIFYAYETMKTIL
ncbi:hypothetical protein PGUG_04368 [Meyerozyma guilliermondii ATCC 6260]|uniref:Mitochondrial thiamine pyrophosphate carrier 1 n=1 Tax=Meyerozyma guilliermondii (strain ATCC 6260 / CBS 566 / DSM 6381 / JCM 1539 / NBRC 10279 / NRRL Y-324) TaxID=294746 RepID=A5DM67_PICGU|nr:uncharacterized protein PGUG_04368 [Meyerozyma guilliermondii ATCC 6260]EDK40270.2 hypothetical protein PGUG_04368 [Meyerozyma guilliermondii ATCC 6260]